jgi:hypothetical protein
MKALKSTAPYELICVVMKVIRFEHNFGDFPALIHHHYILALGDEIGGCLDSPGAVSTRN